MDVTLLETKSSDQTDVGIYGNTPTNDNSCETSSWSSETPLLTYCHDNSDPETDKPQYEQPCVTYTNTLAENKEVSYTESVEVDEEEEYITGDCPTKTEANVPTDRQSYNSSFSLALSGIEEVEPITPSSLHVIGSGWEFGSICSIPFRSNNDIRSSSTTIDRVSQDQQGRLLYRIFKDKIGTLDITKSRSKDISVGFLSQLDECPEEPPCHNNQKNLIVLSLGVMLLHIAIFGLRNLQSSLNSKQGLGVLSLAILFGSFMICSLISPFIVRRFRPKCCLSFACAGHVFYVAANYYPTFYTIIPSAFLHGATNALLWSALSTYITEIGHAEAVTRSKSIKNVLSRYFGVLFLTLQLAMVFGNLVSSVILSLSRTRLAGSVVVNTSLINTSDEVNYMIHSNISSTMPLPVPACGAQQCELDATSIASPPVDDLDKVFLLGTYLFCAVLSVLVIQCCLDPLTTYEPSSASVGEFVQQAGAVLAMIFDKRFCFMVVMCLYTVIGHGFVVADVLKVFITCPLGMKMVGYSMICFGLWGSVSSYIFGKLAKWIGSITAFLIAGLMNITCLALMNWWQPTSDDIYYLFAFIGAWGFADGIWQSQTNSLISTAFAEHYERAFGCCRVLQGLAGILVFSISGILCMTTKIIITMTTCLLAVILYLVMEILNRKHPLVPNHVLNIDVAKI